MTKSRPIIFTIGGIKVEFRSGAADSKMRLLPVPSYQSYVCAGSPDICILVHRPSFPEAILTPPIFEADNWSLYHSGDKVVFQIRFFGLNYRLNTYTSVLEPGELSGDLFLGHEQTMLAKPFELECPPPIFDSVLMINLLAERRGLIIHACGLQNNPKSGLLFAGVSGAGKSTTARIWKQNKNSTKVLGDEKIILRKHEDRYWMYSTPWMGKGQAYLPGSSPLDKIFILHHADRNNARRLTPIESISALLVRSFLPYWDSAGMAYTLAFLEELCQKVPCYELGFVPDASMVEYIQCMNAI